MMFFLRLTLLSILLISLNLQAQSVVDEIEGKNAVSSSVGEGNSFLATETILKISASKRIFIITNNNASFDKGDFITMILKNELVARAIVAKSESGDAGIKVFNIYNSQLWKGMRQGLSVQVLRGDDSNFNKQTTESVATEENVKEEDDLYDKTTLTSEDKIDMEENNNRAIKTDNIISMTYGLLEGIDNEGATQSYIHWSGHWAYQAADNMWGEFSYGQSVINDYPTAGLGTKLSSITLKAKYTIATPFYSFVQPYLGYQMVSASSPGAGQEDEPGVPSDEELLLESEKVDAQKRNGVVFGITLLKRLVPGWFLKVDVGSDIFNLGFGLEF